jgi:O-methyltransferase involved in polyketide biosynthesis
LTPGGDVTTERRLYRDVAGVLTGPVAPTSGLALRTRVVDTEVARALGRGVEQIVLAGAGYDGRALRFGGGTTRWFEADLPATLADKQRRLAALGAVATGRVDVPVDLGRTGLGGADPGSTGLGRADPGGTGLGPALEAAGHDAARPTLFVCEEVAAALTLETTARLCEVLRGRAVPGSTLVAGFEVAPEAGGATRALRAAAGLLPTSTPAAARYRPGDPEKLMVVTGWRVERSETSAAGRFDPGARTQVLVCEPGPRHRD